MGDRECNSQPDRSSFPPTLRLIRASPCRSAANSIRPKHTPSEKADLLHGNLTERIIGEFYDVFNSLGHGFLESIYEEAMTITLRDRGLRVDRQVPVTVHFRGRAIGLYKADLIVESSVILELKASRGIDLQHEAQLINLLRATNLEVGLLMNFGARPSFRRLVFENGRKSNNKASDVSPANGRFVNDT